MKIIYVFILMFITTVCSAGSLSVIPTDVDGNIAASGDVMVTFWDDDTTDGSFNEIELPSGVQCKSVLIQVVSSTDTNFDVDTGFHYSTTGNATKDWTTHTGIVIDVGKTHGSLGYVRAAAGAKVAVLVLY